MLIVIFKEIITLICPQPIGAVIGDGHTQIHCVET